MGRGGVTLLERLLPWLERSAPGALGFVLTFLVQIAGGLVVAFIIGVVLFVVLVKAVGGLFGGLRRHESFPTLFGVCFVIGSTAAALPTAGPIGAVAAFFASIYGAIQTHPRLVEIRDNARAKAEQQKQDPDLSGGPATRPSA